jgi:hypothetical protein
MVEEEIKSDFGQGNPLFNNQNEAKPTIKQIEDYGANLEKKVEQIGSNISIESLVQFFLKTSEPTAFKESGVHGLMINDTAFSNFPDQEAVDVEVDYQDAAAHFALIGELDIALFIMFKVQTRAWTVQGKDGFLRKTFNETRAVIQKTETKQETQTQQQAGGGLRFPKLI